MGVRSSGWNASPSRDAETVCGTGHVRRERASQEVRSEGADVEISPAGRRAAREDVAKKPGLLVWS
eukprot:3760844-Rhodomonas_salina.1